MSVKRTLDKAIKYMDAGPSSEKSDIRKAIHFLKQAASIVSNVGMDTRDRKLMGTVNNIQNDISLLEDALDRL